MQVHKCKGFQISHAFLVHELPHMEEALDRCIYAVHPPAAGVASRRRKLDLFGMGITSDGVGLRSEWKGQTGRRTLTWMGTESRLQLSLFF